MSQPDEKPVLRRYRAGAATRPTTAAIASAISAASSRRFTARTGQEPVQRRAGELILGQEAGGRAGRGPAVVARLAGRGQHRDRSRVLGRGGGQPPGHLEAVGVRQLDVEQHQARPDRPGRVGGFRAGGRLRDREAGGLQRAPGKCPEAVVVVDDQDRRGWPHASSLAPRPALGIRANPDHLSGVARPEFRARPDLASRENS